MKFYKLFLTLAVAFFMMPVVCQMNPFLQFVKTGSFDKKDLKEVALLMIDACKKAASHQEHDDAVVNKIKALGNVLAYRYHRYRYKIIGDQEYKHLTCIACIMRLYEDGVELGTAEDQERKELYVVAMERFAKEVEEFQFENRATLGVEKFCSVLSFA